MNMKKLYAIAWGFECSQYSLCFIEHLQKLLFCVTKTVLVLFQFFKKFILHLCWQMCVYVVAYDVKMCAFGYCLSKNRDKKKLLDAFYV